jgi:hypothetical protein
MLMQGLSSWPCNPMDSPSNSPCASGAPVVASLGCLHVVYTFEFWAKILHHSFPIVHGDDHTTNKVGVISPNLQVPLGTTITMTQASIKG